MPPKIETGHKRTENDQRPEGKGVLLTNGRNLKGGVRALLASLAWETWDNADSMAGLHISGYRHSPALRGTTSSLSQEVEGIGQVNLRGLGGKFWKEDNTPTSISSQVFYKKLELYLEK